MLFLPARDDRRRRHIRPPVAKCWSGLCLARRAGVSRGTVSKALNDTGQLSPETRHRVQAAAAELGFEPNPQPRSLTSGRTFTVGLRKPAGGSRPPATSVPHVSLAEDKIFELLRD
jgi:hypothetical protein